MLTPQKKISKKEIKEDRLITAYFKARAWVDTNKRLAGYIAVAVAALILVAFIWTSRQKENNLKATTQLAKIIPYCDEGKWDLAINGVAQEGKQGLVTIVDEFGSTPAGEIATFYLANAYFATGNVPKAMECYKDVDVDDKMVAASALAGIGACYEAEGNHSEAAVYFEKAASKNMSAAQAPENLQRAAMNFAAAGEKTKAVELLKTMKKEFPASPVARDADRFIAEFGA